VSISKISNFNCCTCSQLCFKTDCESMHFPMEKILFWK